jgi:transcriptional antiterminator RfaH
MGVEAKSYWNVLYTRPRAEKKAAMELAALGAQVYCPTVEVLSQWSDRKKRIQKPALPSMVLVKEDTPDRILFYCKNIRGFVIF